MKIETVQKQEMVTKFKNQNSTYYSSVLHRIKKQCHMSSVLKFDTEKNPTNTGISCGSSSL